MDDEKEDSMDEVPVIELVFPLAEQWRRLSDINIKRYAETLQNLEDK
jgi:hypothetical protein